ncbi:hypothetical protein [Prescottella subtropica]|uniref:hypothetical protein n=1 Tax=Prescottella subtropica TaxID=2545757 RepID=UPI0010F6E3B7|nr:hypothetical protein [Prescottella subtropica]
MSDRYTPKVGDNVVIGEAFLKRGEKIVVYVVKKVNPKTLTLAPLSGVGMGVRIPGYGVQPATDAQVAAAAAVDPAAMVAVGSIVTVSTRKDQLFVVVGETAKGFSLADLNGDGSMRTRAHASLLRKVQVDAAAIIAGAA